jgi:hypothetical protein
MAAEIQWCYFRLPDSYRPPIRRAPNLSGIPLASSAHHPLGFERMPPWPQPPSMPRIKQSPFQDGSKPRSRLCAECSIHLSATGCDRLPRRPGAFARASSRTLHRLRHRCHNRRAAHDPRSFEAAGAETFDCYGDRTGKRILRLISGRRIDAHRRALSASRSQHRPRGNPGIFHWPQRGWLLGGP